jgi:hypothetical protein
MNQLQQVSNMLQSYQAEMNKMQQYINSIGKASAPVAAQPADTGLTAGLGEPDQLTTEQHKMLLGLFKSFISDSKRDGAQELTAGLTKFGRFAQSEFDKLTAKPQA